MTPHDLAILADEATREMAVMDDLTEHAEMMFGLRHADAFSPNIREINRIVRAIELEPAAFATRYLRLENQVKQLVDLLQPIILNFELQQKQS